MSEVRLAEADIRIMQCLQKDPRSSVTGIAKTLQMPVTSVRHRMRRLVKDGVIQFASMTNPLRLGYQVWVMIEIQVRIDKLDSVAHQLEHAPEVYLVYIMTGRYDILVGACFRTNEEFLEFITGRLSKINGITRVSSSSILRLVKRSLSIGLPSAVMDTRKT